MEKIDITPQELCERLNHVLKMNADGMTTTGIAYIADAIVAAKDMGERIDQLERDGADLKGENERLTQKTLDQFVEIQDLRRVANDLSAGNERLKLELEKHNVN